jgi:hypothetical protein
LDKNAKKRVPNGKYNFDKEAENGKNFSRWHRTVVYGRTNVSDDEKGYGFYERKIWRQ